MIRVNSTPLSEYAAAAIIGRWLWRCRQPGFNLQQPELTPDPPVTVIFRLGYKYLGMLEAVNDCSFEEIYRKLLGGKVGKDLIDNIKLTEIQKIAYIADRIATVATDEPDAPDPKYFTGVLIPLVEPYVDIGSPIEMAI